MAERLKPEDRAAGLQELPNWHLVPGREAISRSFKFKDFQEAFAFMTVVAFAAEKVNHHPEWSNVYRTVDIVLATHDVGGLSQLDMELARKIDVISGRFK
ncbi:4a-hydroxytetrahydrobiopterin dehydratase [Roseibium sp.]|uniref:4a-hydroxytetrahydrobiopterin dehydratase n=1 Tax=Roseibium sp. TaxID=1936156 RepID=UPI003B5291CC